MLAKLEVQQLNKKFLINGVAGDDFATGGMVMEIGSGGMTWLMVVLG